MVKLKIVWRKEEEDFFLFSFVLIIDVGDIYDDEGFGDNHAFSTTVSQSEFNNNMTSQIDEETDMNEHEDDTSSYPDDDDDDEEENQIHPDTISKNRPEYHRPIIDSNDKKPLDFQSTSRMPFVASNLWRDLFAKPAILVGKWRFFFF